MVVTSPPRLGLRAYARHRKGLGLPGQTLSAVQKAVRDRRISVDNDGSIDPVAADRDWAGKTRAVAGPTDNLKAVTGVTAMDFNDARAAKETYLAKLRQLEFETKSGELVSTAAVQKTWFAIMRLTRDRVLNVPDRIADQLATETDPSIIHSTILMELNQALSSLASEVTNLEVPT